MKTIIAGSRTITDYQLLCDILDGINIQISEVVSGQARGVDQMGECYAVEHDIPVRKFPALWDIHGKRAGYIRNAEMADYAECLIALWDGSSRGTKHMIDSATKKGLKVFIFHV